MGEPLAAHQEQLDSLAGVALQNWRALDLLSASAGGTWLYLKEECCLYINKSGEVQQNIQSIHESASKIRTSTSLWEPTSWLPNMTWLLPFLGPLFMILLLLLFGPCLFNLLIKFISSRLDQLKKQVRTTLYLQDQNPVQAQARFLDIT